MSIYSIQGVYSPDVIPSQGTKKIDYTFCVSRFWGLRKRETANTMPISKQPMHGNDGDESSTLALALVEVISRWLYIYIYIKYQKTTKKGNAHISTRNGFNQRIRPTTRKILQTNSQNAFTSTRSTKIFVTKSLGDPIRDPTLRG